MPHHFKHLRPGSLPVSRTAASRLQNPKAIATTTLPMVSEAPKSLVALPTARTDGARSPDEQERLVLGVDPVRYYTTKEVAALTGYSVEAFEAWRYVTKTGGPVFSKPKPRCVRYFGADVIEWLRKGRSDTPKA